MGFSKEELNKLSALSRKFHNAINEGCGKNVKTVTRKNTTYDRHTNKHRYSFKDPNLYYALRTYSGEGFFVANKELCKKEQITYGYDIHWAYGGALVDNVFPLSLRVSDTPSELGIIQIKLTYFRPRYKNFEYTVFQNNQFYEELKEFDTLYAWFTDLDYEIFMDMYESDAIIIQHLYYQDVGPLPDKVKELVKQSYIDKKKPENKDFKRIYEAAFYGVNARDLIKSYNNKIKEGRYKFYDDISLNDVVDTAGILHLDGSVKNKQQIRPEYCIIATWQTAYTRYREWQNFKKYMDNVIYMNTDSIYTNIPLNLGPDNGLGSYSCEYYGLPILYLRRCAYIVFNKDGTIHKLRISGIVDKTLTDSQIAQLRAGLYIRNVKTKDENGNIKLITLDPQYINGGVYKNMFNWKGELKCHNQSKKI